MRRLWRKRVRAEVSRVDDAGPGIPADFGRRLARLVVDALEVGTGKRERDVIDELFEAFGLDFAALDRRVPPQTIDRTAVLRARAADELARAAPGAAALLEEVLKRGSRFVSMLDDVYARLAKHDVTTLVAAKVFRVGRDEVKIDLNISKAFLEQVRELQQVLEKMTIGAMDETAVRHLVGFDNGECYGRWPLNSYDTGFRLADAVHHLGWISERLSAESRSGFAGLTAALAETNRAADRLCSIAEGLVHSHVVHLEWLERMRSDGQDLSDDELRRRLFSSGQDWDDVLADVQTYRRQRILGIAQYTDRINGLGGHTFLGVDGDLRYRSFPTDKWQGGSGMAVLATFLAMRRVGAYSTPRRDVLETELFETPEQLAEWLDTVRTGCEEATQWLSEDVVTRSGALTISGEMERIREFLNLPLWHARDLLYEIWVLCATLAACEESGWDVELRELEGEVWTLAVGATQRPVASLARGDMPDLSLDVWREPRRVDHQGGVLTPDVTISTPPPVLRDLVVVEAKDRLKMSVGSAQAADSWGRKGTAVAVALKYAEGLRSPVTWVCNHCDYRQPVDPSENHGNPWSRIHIAGSFRPGEVPDGFAPSVSDAISPPIGARVAEARAAEARAGLMLVIDWTGSFEWGGTSALQRLADRALADGVAVRAVLFADHGENEPFLVRKLGPADSVAEILRSADRVPRGGHGDVSALEDALARCREIVADIGPQDVVILTDAPSHNAEKCAYGIDYRQELRGLLEAGCRVMVADDWGVGVGQEDLADHLPPELLDRLIREPLSEILTRVGKGAVETPSLA